MIKILREEVLFQIERAVSRWHSYRNHYWSANVANFDETKMPQNARSKYFGKLLLGRPVDACSVKEAADYLASEQLEFAEVVEGFEYGMECADHVRKYGSIIAPGTIGVEPSSKSDYVFAPVLFVFKGEKPDEAISYGVERLNLIDGQPIIKEGQVCLIREVYII